MSISVVIDGKTCSCEPGEYLAGVAARNDIYIPTLCATKKALLGRGSCRICIVEVVESGRKKVVASCIYPISKSCEVFTKSDQIIKKRGVILALLLRLAPDAELITEMAKDYDIPNLGSLEAFSDARRCILCGLCVEACKTLGAEAITTVGRGVGKKVSTPYDDVSSGCIGCATCATVCPTNSIPVRTSDDVRVIWGKEFTVTRCGICGEEMGTAESLAYARKRADEAVGPDGIIEEEAASQQLCPKHRSQWMASRLVATERASI